MQEHTFETPATELGLSFVVDVFDRHDLFRPLDNEEVLNLSRLGGAPGFSSTRAIRKSTAISQRRKLAPGVTPEDLAVAVMQRLQSVSQTSLRDFDRILLCHSHTDPTECKRLAQALTARFRLPPGMITASNYGCAGYLKLISDGTMRLEGQPPGGRMALVSVETPEFWHDAADRLFCGIVSAGATASVLESGSAGLPVGTVRSDDFLIPESRRPNPDPLFSRETTEVFDFDGSPCHRTVMRMNAEPVFLNGIELMLDNLRAALLGLEIRPGERVVVAPHQPSGKLLKALIAAGEREFPELEFLDNLEYYGNTISSSVPTLLSRMDEVLERNELQPLRDGDHIILLAAGICMASIADYMSAGHACLRWQSGALNVPRPEAAAVSSFSR